MGSRLELHEELVELVPRAYYQPPATVRMQYPCIVYHLNDIRSRYADNFSYTSLKSYLLTYISQTVDDVVVTKILESFPYCRFDRYYTADNLHHYVFELYY